MGYVGTGSGNTTDFWQYDPANNTWTQKANFPGGAKSNAVGFSIGSKGYIGTGATPSDLIYLKDLWEYNPSTDMWIQKSDLEGPERTSAVAFSIGNKS